MFNSRPRYLLLSVAVFFQKLCRFRSYGVENSYNSNWSALPIWGMSLLLYLLLGASRLEAHISFLWSYRRMRLITRDYGMWLRKWHLRVPWTRPGYPSGPGWTGPSTPPPPPPPPLPLSPPPPPPPPPPLKARKGPQFRDLIIIPGMLHPPNTGGYHSGPGDGDDIITELAWVTMHKQ